MNNSQSSVHVVSQLSTTVHVPGGDSDTFFVAVKACACALFDKGFAILALLFFAPFFILIAAVIVVTDGGPVLYGHPRIGRNGKSFKCLKFRTMVTDSAEQLAKLLDSDPEARAQWDATQKLDDDPRVTCLGEFFRKTSLDELPQFWNVVRGDMAIVGPRPIVADELARYGADQSLYLSVKPGITGAWQVSGRSDTTYAERVEMDANYVKTKSFMGDLAIICKTVGVVLKSDGAR